VIAPLGQAQRSQNIRCTGYDLRMSVNPYESPKVAPQPRRRHDDEQSIEKMLRPWVLGGTLLNLLLAVFFVWQIPKSLPFGFVGIFAVIQGVIGLTYLVVKKSLLRGPLMIPEEDQSDWLPR
jgi:hypothetical protein